MSTGAAGTADDQFDELRAEVEEYEGGLDEAFPDVGLGWEAEKADQWEEFADRLSDVDRSQLSDHAQADYDVLERELEFRIKRYDYQIHLMPVNHEGGPHSAYVRYPSQHSFEELDDYERYLHRLEHADEYFDEARTLLIEGIERGFTPPRSVLHGHGEMIESYLVDDSTESTLYEPFEEMPATIDETDRERLRDAATAAITDAALPALEQFRTFLVDEYIPETRETTAYADLPDGEAYYEHLVRYYTTLDVTPDDVHQTGLEEVERIREEMLEVIDDAGFEGNFDEFVEFLRNDPQFYPDSEEELLGEAKAVAKDVDGRLPSLFTLDAMPTRPYGVEPVPEDIAPSYTSGRYVSNPTESDSGTFWLNTYGLDSRPLYALPALFLHEAVPGHHHQIAHTTENEKVSEFRRDNLVNAYIEGWALYAERLGLELDVYETPYEQFGRLSNEMWRACRLVVDTGIHTKGWSPEKAREFMAENTALSMHNVRTEVDRYVAWPGQSLAYKMGEIKVRDLRREAEDELGAQFDVRAFHETFLESGPVPLPTLAANVREWIDGFERDTSTEQ
ncbi:DUF885 domain-containing protein [Halolamina salifodinae]|uniref:Uncharacterized protein (DUF885 family) n=1 Tax=Halolamina salifodinae TaxID=1202767 RepID=A0A8T4GZ38_9EURY|nr:DUF885 domain-containing protein [Halolamina salifodinae]MBP1986824.1 uncharacterized protein (DUF885 family) [Halolamina salifodinae]